MTDFSKGKVTSFDGPTRLPQDKEQQEEWLTKNKEWWEKNPMRYDWKKGIAPEEFTIPFYEEIDRRSFSSMAPTIPSKAIPFDSLIDFHSLADKDVLEIGVGNGTHAQLLAKHSRSFTGIDLTEYGTRSTSTRMSLMGIRNAMITRMNAEELEFPENRFDFIWSWGVIHHSANTPQILSEICRVMKNGARFKAMVYHRGWWNYYVCGFLGGLVKGGLSKGIHGAVQNNSDGAIARFYGPREWKRDLEAKGFKVISVGVMGLKPEIIPLPGGRLKSFLLSLIPDSVSYLLTSKLRMGSFLVSEAEKK